MEVKEMKKLLLVVLLMFAFTMYVSAANVTIWFAGTTGSLMDLVDNEMIPAFEEEYPDINVRAEFIPWGELSTKLTTSFAGGIGPDIFMHGQAAIAGFAANEVIRPIDELIPLLEDPSDFGSSLDAGKYLGKSYFVPVFGSGQLLVYRADFFEEAGLDPDEPPLTWEQLKVYAKAMTETSNGRITRAGMALPVEGIDLQQIWTGFLVQNGGRLFDEEMNPVFNSPEGVEALEFYVDLIRNQNVCPDTGVTSIGNVPPVGAGTAAMAYMPMELVKDIMLYAPEVKDEIRVALSPARYRRGSFYSFAGFMVSRTTDDIDATTKVLRFFTSKEAIIDINKALGSLPPRQSSVEAEFVAEDPLLQMYVKGSKYAFGNPNVPFWVQARDIISKYLERAVRGVLAPKVALDKAAQEIIELQ
jgi:multiple sugar transport system substrate-binding protein